MIYAAACAILIVAALFAFNGIHWSASAILVAAAMWCATRSSVTADQLAGAIGLVGLLGILAGVFLSWRAVPGWGF